MKKQSITLIMTVLMLGVGVMVLPRVWRTRPNDNQYLPLNRAGAPRACSVMNAEATPFTPFLEWMRDWDLGLTDLSQGVTLAQERKVQMQRLMKDDPELAYKFALEQEVWTQLPEELKKEVEHRFSGEGTFEVAQDCESEQVWHHLTMEEFSTGNAFVAPRLSGRKSFKGTMKGVVLGSLCSLVAMEGEGSLPANLEAPPAIDAAPVTGTYPVLWLNIKFSDEGTYPSAGTALSDAATAFNQYSYGRLTVTYDVVNVDIAATRASNPSDSTIISQAQAAAVALGYTISNYLTILYRQTLYGQYAGLYNDPGYVMLSKSVKETTVHEIAHNMGVHHANWWKANTGQPAWGAGVNQLYGEDWDAMAFDNPRGDFNVPEKMQLGWFDQGPDYSADVTNGIYRVYDYRTNSRAFSTNGVTGAYYGVSVFKDTAAVNGENDSRRYVLSYRNYTNVGATQFTEGLHLHWNPWTYNGSSGYGVNGPYGSDIIDTHPTINGVNDAPLAIGETYIDSSTTNRDGTIYITVLKKIDPDGIDQTGDESLDVKIVVGNPVGNQAPTGTLSFAKSIVGPREAAVMTVSATDPNNDTLAYLWDFGLGTTVANRQAMPLDGSSTQQFVYATEKSYTVKVTISDCRGGTCQLTTSLIVSNTPPVVNAGTNQVAEISGASVSWTPADITTLAWYDAADATTVQQTGGAVTNWLDKSGNAHHVLQGTASKRPLYSATGWNGALPALSFGGSNVLTSATLSDVGAGERTVFIVYDSVATPSTATQYLLDMKGAAEQFYYAVSSSVPTLLYKGSATSSALTDAVSGKHIVAFGNDARTRIYKDGTLGVDDVVNQTTNNTITQINVGSRNSSEYFQGVIAEVIVIPFTLSDMERQVVEGYLANKWGLTSNLPGGHPFKTSAPGGQRVTVSLAGTATDSNVGQSVTTKWSPVSGPSPFSIANTLNTNTTALFTVPGTYTLRLTADDSYDQAFDDVVITVNGGLTITATAGTGGSIAPSGVVSLAEGANQTFTMTPDTGYSLTNVLVDSVSVGATNSYTFYNVTTQHTIHVSFAINQYTFVVEQGATPVSIASAQLSGVMTSGIVANAWICWGLTDAGTASTGAWAHVVSIGSVSNNISFSTTVNGLATNTTYFYRCYVKSANSSDWSDSGTFSGTPTGSSGGTPVLTVVPISAVYAHNEKANFEGKIDDMTNGSGMNGYGYNGTNTWPVGEGLPATWTATSTAYQSEWVSGDLLLNEAPVNNKIGWVIFDLGSVSSLQMLYLWHIRNSSTSCASNYNVYVASAPSFAPTHGPTDTTSIDYNFASGGWTLINTGGPLTGVYRGSQSNSLGGVSGRYVACEFLSNFGHASRVGLAEIGITADESLIVIGNLAPSSITNTSATFNGTLATGSTNYSVYVYYGTTNGGTNAGSWTTSAYVGSWTNVSTNVSYTASSLSSGQTYYYTLLASNATTQAWASPSWQFSIPGVPTYTVSYDGNGNTSGSAPGSQTKTNDVVLTLATQGSLSRTGYTFANWNTATNGFGTNYAAGGSYTVNEAITLYAKWVVGNTAPVAYDAAVVADKDIAVGIVLTATDADVGDTLSYTVVDAPTNGTLSGTAPNLKYTPGYHFSGSDSFTFKANDGTNDSNLATVSITVKGVQVLDYTAPTPGTVKTYKVALLMINTLTASNHVPDNPVTPKLEFYSPEKLGQIFFEHQHGAAAFLHEASYGKIAIEGRVVGWIDQPTAGLNGTDISANKDYWLSLADPYLTHTNYDIFVVHSLVEGSMQQTGWLYPQQSFTSASQGAVTGIGIDWMADAGVFDVAPLDYSNWSSGDTVLPTTSWAHEMLHTFGITGHANSYDCSNVVIATEGPLNPLKAYGGCFSIMGEYAYSTHPDALMKSRIGWLSQGQIPELTTNGTYTIYPLETADGNIKAVVIPLEPSLTHTQHTAQFDALIVEYRTATGFDRYLQRLDGSAFLSLYTSLTNINREGVLVYLRYDPATTTTDSTVLLDMNPTTTYNPTRGIKWPGNTGKFADAILPVNQIFTWQGITITPLGTNAMGAMQVSVTGFQTNTATVTLGNLAQTYNATARVVTYTTSPTGLAVTVTYNGGMTAPTNAGSYAVTGTVVSATYQGATNGTLVVSKGTPTVDTWPVTTNEILVGQAISNAPLTGGSASVAGSFSYDAPGTVPSVGVYTAAVTFAASDSANYQAVTGTVAVTVSALLLHSLPFAENFESLDAGNLDGQNNWSAVDAVVQTNTAIGTKAGSITSATGFASQSFAGNQTNVWTDFVLQTAFFASAPAVADTNVTAIVYFNAAGHPVAFSNAVPVELASCTVTNGVWTRVTIWNDYAAKKWDLYINTVQVASNLGFYNVSATHYTGFKVVGAGVTSVALDELTIGLLQPWTPSAMNTGTLIRFHF